MYIELKDYVKTIKGATVLDNINIHLESGVVYGLKGKNGSGKTMLMRAISGLIKPTSGQVDINGEILGKDISFPRSMGILLENPAFIDNETGFWNLKILASIKGIISDDEIRQTIEDVGLNPNDKRKYRKYSLGMKQRLGVAAAVMENPDIIILDEPVNALDNEGIECVHKLLIKAREQGSLIIIACHDSEELNVLSDVIINISEGKIVDESNEQNKR